MDELYNINFKERKLSMYMLRIFLYEMWGSVVKLLDQVKIDDKKINEIIESDFLDIISMGETERSYQNLINIYRRICTNVNQLSNNKNQQMINEVLQFVRNSYMHPELSLALLSTEFNITEAYLSRLFKEHTASNISEYIEKLRMKKAVELLLKTDFPVGEIAEKIGYSSTNTFGRAFKRINGISATKYRRTRKPSADI